MYKLQGRPKTASQLLKEADEIKGIRESQYQKEFQKCMDTIETASRSWKYTRHQIPVTIHGDPSYDYKECIKFLKVKLRQSEFFVKTMEPGNILFISWRPEDVSPPKVEKVTQKVPSVPKVPIAKVIPPKVIIDYDPNSAMSNVKLRSKLMVDNPKYAHLKSVQKMKRKKK